MALAVTKHGATPERQVVIGMIDNKAVLGPIAARWTEVGLFASKWSNLLGGWAVEHYKKYAAEPKGAIENYYRAWAETGDRDTVELIGSFLTSLSDESKRLRNRIQGDHLLNIAAELFERVGLHNLVERTDAYLQTGQVAKARGVVEKSRKVEIGLGAGIDVLCADAEFEAAITHARRPVIRFDDEGDEALAAFFGDSLYKGAFVAFMAKQKSAKSFAIQDLAWRAVEQDKKVAYFECGDSTQIELLQRFAVRTAGRPIEAGRYRVPVSMEVSGNQTPPEIEWDRPEWKENMSVWEEKTARTDFRRRHSADSFKVVCKPSGSISVAGIETVLESWARDDWYPDVCFVDYPDILAPIDRHFEKRDQVNQTWMALRGLSQKWQCLVAAVTQIKADGFNKWLLDREDFSEDNRKYGHVTSMFGINQTKKEKPLDVFRLNYIVGRTLTFAEDKYLWTAGCLGLARPFILSSFGN